jgi:DNA/RNA endonuclease G (NUC1)
MIKKLILLAFVLITTTVFSQTVKITGSIFTINHGDLTFYLDKDTSSYVSVHKITSTQIKRLSGIRKDRWHIEKPYGPYKKSLYVNTGYDLGHLTPSKITMYNDSVNFHTFSMFNEAPQLSQFNEHPWEQLEMSVINIILKTKCNAVIITGVIYDNKHKQYLGKSRIKIPTEYYKILVLSNGTTYAWIGSNVNGLISKISVESIVQIAKDNGNNLDIEITK